MRPISLLTSAAAAGALLAGLCTSLQAASPLSRIAEQTGGLTAAATASATVTPSPTLARATRIAPSAASSATSMAQAPATTIVITPVATVVVPVGLPTPTPAPVTTSTTAPLSPTAPVSAPVTVPVTTSAQISDIVPAQTAVALTTTQAITAASGVTGVEGATALDGVIEGTVVANRTPSLVLFFVDGKTYTLDPQRSAGLNLVRPTSVLNLYNCDATAGDQQDGCFWDPYLLRKDGFYEVVAGKDAGALVSLILREAGAPPDNQVWIQNRTGHDEDIYFGTQMRPIAPASVEEFSVDSGGVGVFYLRTCVDNAGTPVCEWTAHSAQPGGYYALVADEWDGGPSGSTVTNLELTPILGGDVVTSTTVSPEEKQTVCRLAVPALNVRSGPGLEFDIVKKIRSSDVEIATVVVTARTELGDWLRVDERIATGGWVIAGSEYLNCDGDIMALPVVTTDQLPATPTPTPEPYVEAPVDQTVAVVPVDIAPEDVVPIGGSQDASVVASTQITGDVPASEPAAPAIPAGQAMLTVQNSFDRQMRFTLDQQYRAQPGPSENDLDPGQTATFLVYPGVVPFTASSPWQGLSGNDDVHIDADQAKTLYLYFAWDTEDKRWELNSTE